MQKPSKRGGSARRTTAQVVAHLAANIAIKADGCMEWTGRLSNVGYPAFNWMQSDGVVMYGGHRIAHHLFNSPISRHQVVDHLCRNRACVNPAHLEAVTQRENVLRSPVAIGALNAAKTHCKHGHEFSPENTYLIHHKPPKAHTERVCKTCRSNYARTYKARKKGIAA